MGDNGRTWIIPKTTKLIPLDIAMPSAKTTLPSGLIVDIQETGGH